MRPAGPWRLLVPVVAPETWAAGVTYERSRDARLPRARSPTSTTSSTRRSGPSCSSRMPPGGGRSGPASRSRSGQIPSWSVPEPELAVVIGEDGDAARGHDRQRRLGARHRGRQPALSAAGEGLRRCLRARARAAGAGRTGRSPFEIELRITAGTARPVRGRARPTGCIARSGAGLVPAPPQSRPAGSVLLTGTGIVPPDDVTLAPGQQVRSGSRNRELRNPVRPAD